MILQTDITRSNVIGVLYGLLALALHLWGRYRNWWWYDNVAHAAAGISLGSLVASDESSPTQDGLLVGGITAAWEITEYFHGAYPWGELPDRAAAEDTVLDSILVAVGALIAIWGADDD